MRRGAIKLARAAQGEGSSHGDGGTARVLVRARALVPARAPLAAGQDATPSAEIDPHARGPGPLPKVLQVDIDGRRVTLSAADEVVLRCGQASITLDASGRVAIRGTQVVSRASGTHKIRGGSVHIN